jgi:hypothetical protein
VPSLFASGLKPLFGFVASTSGLTLLMVLLSHVGRACPALRSSPVHPLSGTMSGIEKEALEEDGACGA